MAELTGKNALTKVDIAGTPTAFGYEINSRLTIGGDTISAQNKSTTGWSSQAEVSKNFQVEVDANVDDTANPALDVVKNAKMANPSTVLSDTQFVVGSLTGWTFTGDTQPGPWNVGGGSNDFVSNGFTLLGQGALVAS